MFIKSLCFLKMYIKSWCFLKMYKIMMFFNIYKTMFFFKYIQNPNVSLNVYKIKMLLLNVYEIMMFFANWLHLLWDVLNSVDYFNLVQVLQ